jgi:hypothetical protein
MTPMSLEPTPAKPSRAPPWSALALCALVAFAAFFVPMYVIRPFRAQGAAELAVALVVRRYGPWVALVSAVAGLAVATLLWRGAVHWRTRIGAAALSLFTLFFTALSHVNVYEIMFHPAGNPQFEAAEKAKIDKDDMVLSVSLGGESHAYPIRTMGYHHIANDWVGGVPIAATY